MIGPCPTFETQPIGQQRIYTRTTDRIDMSNLESNVQKLFQERQAAEFVYWLLRGLYERHHVFAIW